MRSLIIVFVLPFVKQKHSLMYFIEIYSDTELKVGCVAQLAERRSLAGELTLSGARPSADG